jgi:hypothetical protein
VSLSTKPPKSKNKYVLLFLAPRGKMEFEKVKQILNTESENKYTDQEIIEIMQILEVFADVWVNNLLKSTKNEKCNSLC